MAGGGRRDGIVVVWIGLRFAHSAAGCMEVILLCI